MEVNAYFSLYLVSVLSRYDLLMGCWDQNVTLLSQQVSLILLGIWEPFDSVVLQLIALQAKWINPLRVVQRGIIL